MILWKLQNGFLPVRLRRLKRMWPTFAFLCQSLRLLSAVDPPLFELSVLILMLWSLQSRYVLLLQIPRQRQRQHQRPVL